MELGDYLLNNNPQVSKASIEIDEKCWERLVIDGDTRCDNIQAGGCRSCRPCAPSATAKAAGSITSGVDGLTILKTTKSAFTGYIKDKLTTLKPATDRILGTRATVKWDYVSRLPRTSPKSAPGSSPPC